MRIIIAISLFISGCATNQIDQYLADRDKAYWDRLKCKIEMQRVWERIEADRHIEMGIEKIPEICANIYPAPRFPSECDRLDK